MTWEEETVSSMIFVILLDFNYHHPDYFFISGWNAILMYDRSESATPLHKFETHGLIAEWLEFYKTVDTYYSAIDCEAEFTSQLIERVRKHFELPDGH